MSSNRDNGCPSKLFHMLNPLEKCEILEPVVKLPGSRSRVRSYITLLKFFLPEHPEFGADVGGSLFIFNASPWVSFVVYLGQMLEVKVCVDLSGTDIGMPQQFLDTSKVVA